MSKRSCRKCGTELAAREGAGRPPSYCSTGCRRAAEYELRRVQGALESAENRMAHHREYLALRLSCGLQCCGGAGKAEVHLSVLDDERARLEERMRLLLGDDGREGDNDV